MNVLWITLALLTAGFAGWPVTALVFRLARTIDDRQAASAGADPANDPSADATAEAPTPEAAAATAGAPSAGDAAPAAGSAAPAAGAVSVSSVRILRGGAIIGVLERLAVCLAILAANRSRSPTSSPSRAWAALPN